MKTGHKNQKKDIMEDIGKLDVRGNKTLTENEDDKWNSMGMSLNDIRKKRMLDDEIDLQINIQSEMMPLHCLPDTQLSERSTMTTFDKQLMERSTMTTDDTH